MNKKPEILATITEDLDLEYSVPRLLKAVLQHIGTGKPVRVDISRWYKKRTLKQNATSWGPDYNVIQLFLAEKAGEIWSHEEIHEFHKKKFLGYEESAMAEGLLRPKSTTKLNTKQFAEFREWYCRFWAELGCYIPDPKPQE